MEEGGEVLEVEVDGVSRNGAGTIWPISFYLWLSIGQTELTFGVACILVISRAYYLISHASSDGPIDLRLPPAAYAAADAAGPDSDLPLNNPRNPPTAVSQPLHRVHSQD